MMMTLSLQSQLLSPLTLAGLIAFFFFVSLFLFFLEREHE